MLYLLYKHSPSTLGTLTVQWNDTIGHFWGTYVLELLSILQTVFEMAVGVYNFVIFLLLKLPFNLLLHTISGGMPELTAMGKEIAKVGTSLQTSIVQYTKYEDLISSECPNAFGDYDNICFNYAASEIDFYTPLTHFNDAMYHLISFIPSKCRLLNQPIILLLHPLTDTELAKVLHYILNSVKQISDVVRITVRRCDASQQRIPLCFPDLNPWFDTLVYMFTHVGRMLDNWLDIAHYLVITLIDPSKIVSCDSLQGIIFFL